MIYGWLNPWMQNHGYGWLSMIFEHLWILVSMTGLKPIPPQVPSWQPTAVCLPRESPWTE